MSDDGLPMDDMIDLSDDSMGCGAGSDGPPWRILVVDDDEQVHQVTEYSVGDLDVCGRHLEFLHAFSAAEAQKVLASDPTVAVVLLDVVMEKPDSGLELARWIREDLHNADVRIILRTGQPGYAPELEVIRDYDINDYRSKAELTRTRLVSALTTAIRSYEQLCIVSASREGLRRVIDASLKLLSRTTLPEYSDSVLSELRDIFGIKADCLMLMNPRPGSLPIVEAASGSLRRLLGCRCDKLPSPLCDVALRCRNTHRHVNEGGVSALMLAANDDREAIIVVDGPAALDEIETELLSVFASNVGVGIENVTLLERLQAMIYSDDLTGLPNRSGVMRRLKQLTAMERESAVLAMLYVDRFTEVNDALGHQTGDELLRQIASRLAEVVGHAELGRVGAGLFSILGPEDAIRPELVMAQFEEPIEAGGYQVPVSVHLGLARIRDTEAVGSDAFKGASIAVNNARRDAQQNWQYYAQAQELEGRERLDLLQGLRAALDQDELVVFYQPQLELSTNTVIGAEALIRWRRANGEYVSPGKFIPLAEYSGLIIPIGDFVLRSACRQVAEWQRMGLPKLRIGVNVSSQQFQRERYVQSVESALADTGVDPEWIELEVTESAAMADVRSVIAVLHDLRSLGVTLAVDDFGTGYSSLSYLHQLPVHRLKVDQSFVSAMTATSGHGIPKMVIDLAHQLGLTAIAEGVTNQDQADILLSLGCEEGQGFYYSRPVDAESYVEWLRAYGPGAD